MRLREPVLGLIVLAWLAGCATAPPQKAKPQETRRIQIPPPRVAVVTPADTPRRSPQAQHDAELSDLDRDGPPDPEEIPENLVNLPDPVPVPEPKSAGGNPTSYEVFGKEYRVMPTATGYRETGLASWYGKKFHGRKTSNGERYDMFKLTAAHKSLPLPSWARVTNLANGKSVIVRINDRGPFHKGRILDLSYAAAAKLETLGKIATVEIEVITPGEELPPPPRLETEIEVAHKGDPVAWLLQVAAYSDPINAIAIREELAELGITGIKVRLGTLDNGDPVHRVVVGPFDQRQRMDETRVRIRGAGFEAFPILE
ncbi:MAG: septal ring lytic transglycosylase RlpA family protein [Panacagrimonas sp.]